MTKPSILVTRRWPKNVEKRLCKLYDTTLNDSNIPLDATTLRDSLLHFDAVLPTVTDKIDATVLNVSNPRAKILANYGVGYSHICADSAQKAGLIVTNTPEVLSECTADIAMTLMLMVARRAGEGEREARAGKWKGWHPTHMVGTKVSGKTLGIVGFGRIGQEMAKRAYHGFGMRIITYSIGTIEPDVLAKYDVTRCNMLEDLLTQSDYVSLHCPGGDENRHLINEKTLRTMKKSAFLINTARGEVVNEQDLGDALKNGTIAGAGLDVFEHEPQITPELTKLDNIVLLPHLGSATLETREAMGFRVLDNLEDFFAGKKPRDRVI